MYVFRFLFTVLLVAGQAQAQELPDAVQAALARAKVPSKALSVMFTEVQPASKPRLRLRASEPLNPASVMKLVTTTAALDLMGPAYTWQTPIYLGGPVHEGTLQGNLYIQGQGDPQIVLERMWLMLRRVQGLGVRQIAGDIVIDRSAFNLAESDPADFDGDPLRPYNASPDAMLLNFKSVVMTFTPDTLRQRAMVQFDPPLAGVQLQESVPLAPGDCGDYRAQLKLDASDPLRIRFAGSYPASCGERIWPLAYADSSSFAPRALQGLWSEMGGKLTGIARYGNVPPTLLLDGPTMQVQSAPLSEIIRSINKYSNNVMAQQLFLALGRLPPDYEESAPDRADSSVREHKLGVASFAASRLAVRRWWTSRFGEQDVPQIENGSGLSRQERISCDALVRLLQFVWLSPYMPELVSSLPLFGVDGTLRHAHAPSTGSAHLKTGTLRDVVALAGYVNARSGRQFVLVVLINHPNAPAARPAMEAMVDWAIKDN